jgi:hypothetical protein
MSFEPSPLFPADLVHLEGWGGFHRNQLLQGQIQAKAHALRTFEVFGRRPRLTLKAKSNVAHPK